jgi:hypothetical protein
MPISADKAIEDLVFNGFSFVLAYWGASLVGCDPKKVLNVSPPEA